MPTYKVRYINGKTCLYLQFIFPVGRVAGMPGSTPVAHGKVIAQWEEDFMCRVVA